MSYTRDLVYALTNGLARVAQESGLPRGRLAIEPGGDVDDYLHGLLNQVEDDRVHAEADKLRNRAKGILDDAGSDRRTAELMAGVMTAAAMGMDPYEEKDGQLVHKSDGSPVRSSMQEGT